MLKISENAEKGAYSKKDKSNIIINNSYIDLIKFNYPPLINLFYYNPKELENNISLVTERMKAIIIIIFSVSLLNSNFSLKS